MRFLGRHFKLTLGLFAVLALALASAPAMALLVQPVLIKLTTTGASSSAGIEVVNDRSRPITVEVTVNTLELPELGQPVLTPDDGDEFQIFPIQAVIPAGGRQVFRVRWMGDPALAEAKLYMFNTSELPVALDEGQSGISMYYAIQSVVAVSPTGARPDISIDQVRRFTNSQGEAGLAITFDNSGAAVGYVTEGEMRLSVAGSNWSLNLSPADMNAAFGLGIVPANAKRAMFFASDSIPADGEITARFQPRSGG